MAETLAQEADRLELEAVIDEESSYRAQLKDSEGESPGYRAGIKNALARTLRRRADLEMLVASRSATNNMPTKGTP